VAVIGRILPVVSTLETRRQLRESWAGDGQNGRPGARFGGGRAVAVGGLASGLFGGCDDNDPGAGQGWGVGGIALVMGRRLSAKFYRPRPVGGAVPPICPDSRRSLS